MQRVAGELCKIQEYELFKLLMKEVRYSLKYFLILLKTLKNRKLEADISKYQDQLRRQIHKKELNIYEKIGEERLDDFYDKYDTAFKRVEIYIFF